MNREIINNPSSTGLAQATNALQQHLYDSLPWLEKAYGLAVDGHAVNAEKLTLTVPEVYLGGGEYGVVLPDDRNASQSFLYADAAEVVKDFVPFDGYRMECPVSIMVWLELDKLKAEMGWIYEHRYVDELKKSVLDALNQYSDYEVSRIEGHVHRMWQNWTIGRGVLFYGDRKEYAISQIGKHPEAGFRIFGTLSYEESCRSTDPFS